jgi:Bacterial protein of unknown function (DUF885)
VKRTPSGCRGTDDGRADRAPVHIGRSAVASRWTVPRGPNVLTRVRSSHSATRATYDPTYGRYTWGKLEIMSLRDQAIAAWGTAFSLRRFHEALLALGAPPLGTMGDALTA